MSVAVVYTCDVCGREIDSYVDWETGKRDNLDFVLPALDGVIPCCFKAHLCHKCHFEIAMLISELSKKNEQ